MDILVRNMTQPVGVAPTMLCGSLTFTGILANAINVKIRANIGT